MKCNTKMHLFFSPIFLCPRALHIPKQKSITYKIIWVLACRINILQVPNPYVIPAIHMCLCYLNKLHRVFYHRCILLANNFRFFFCICQTRGQYAIIWLASGLGRRAARFRAGKLGLAAPVLCYTLYTFSITHLIQDSTMMEIFLELI